MVKGNICPYVHILLFIFVIESIIGFLGNGFIIVVNAHRWFQSRKILLSDLLLTALATTRFLLQVVFMLTELLYIYSSVFIKYGYVWRSFFCAWIYFSSASIWCATWLSVFYCVKVTSFAHHFFLWLKLRINMFMPRILGLSLTVFSLPLAASTFRENVYYCTPTRNMTGNISQSGDSNNCGYIFIFMNFFFVAINVGICLTASILLLISLWSHTRNMKRSGFITKDLNTQVHISLVYSLLSFIFFYIVYAVVLTLSLSYYPSITIVEGLTIIVVLSMCPSAHSIVLILTNPKLKQMFVQIIKIRQRIL